MISKETTIRALVVGGNGGIAASHINAMNEVPGILLAAIVEDDAASAEAATNKYSVPGYTDIEAVPLSDYDAVIDCTPTSSHRSFAIYAAEHDKHLLVEKPLANTIENGEKIIDAFRDKDLVAFLGLTMRFYPEVIEAKRIFDAGEIGDLLCYMERGYIGRPAELWKPWPLSRETAGGGVQTSMGVHGVDRLEWFTGRKVESIEYARCDNLILGRTVSVPCDVEDSSVVLARLEGNRFALIHNQWVSFRCMSWAMEVVGERGRLTIKFLQGIDVTMPDGTIHERRMHEVSPNWAEQMHPAFVNEYQAFVEAVATGDASLAPLEDGLRHLLLIKEIYEKSGYYHNG